jgi:Secretion system C-terminal sorting domain
MKKLFTLILLFVAGFAAKAQMTAMDFNRADCNGNMHHLFADLDAGNAVILEYFMLNCTPCITAGNKLEAMKSDLLAAYPGKVKSYAIGFTNAYVASDIAAWVATHGFSSIPMDSGTASVAYYGGFGMPTVVILGGGTSHLVLGSPYVGFSTSDTTTMAADIRQWLSTPTALTAPTAPANFSLFPQPASDAVQLNMDMTVGGNLAIDLFDLTGRKLQTLYDGHFPAGAFAQTISTSIWATGTYLLQVRQGETRMTKRLVVTH